MDRASVWVGISGQIKRVQGGGRVWGGGRIKTKSCQLAPPESPWLLLALDVPEPMTVFCPLLPFPVSPWEDGPALTGALLLLCVHILRPFVS